MIFKIKEKEKHKVGDKKTTKRFAILPTKINSTTIVWLEKYFIQYELSKNLRIENFQWCNYEHWKEIDRWIEKQIKINIDKQREKL